MTDWRPITEAVDAALPDERIRGAVRDFLDATGGELVLDGEVVRLAPEMEVLIEQKGLVLDRNHQGGAFLTARVVLDPIVENGQYVGLSFGGTIRFVFALDGEYLDEVYSRGNVVPR